MIHSIGRTVFAGALGGIVFSVLTMPTFGVLGTGGGHGTGLLFNPATQSAKLLAVWTQIKPLPLMIRAPIAVFAGFTVLIMGYSFLFEASRKAWPEGYWNNVIWLALLIWFFSCTFFEFFGSLNLLAEPIPLISIELVFWAVCSVGASITIVGLLRGRRVL